MLKTVAAGDLEIAYFEWGKASGPCVVLLHGFPYDAHACVDAAQLLAAQHYRVIAPFLRGYGPTRFLSEQTPRSGQQAALAQDLKNLLDALTIKRTLLAGYDWGGRAACIVAALWPERVTGLVTGGGYNIQHIASAMTPDTPEAEWRYWYQFYFFSERGRAGLTQHRRDLLQMLWRHWSPSWAFSEPIFARTAVSFDNRDFVDVVIHSYRHRFGLADGDPQFDVIEKQLANDPVITVPTIAIEGDNDGVTPLGCYKDGDHLFTQLKQRRVIKNAGHNLPQEAPEEFVAAILALS